MQHLVIFFSGKQGSGKSTARDLMIDILEEKGMFPYRLRFAHHVYELADMIEAYLAPFVGRDPLEKNGPLLQAVGDIGRQLYGESIWVDSLYKDLKKVAVSEPRLPIVFLIEDTRMENELALHKKLKDEGFKTLTIRLEAPEEIRKPRAKSWRKNTQHLSEIGLDHMVDTFDAVIETTRGLDVMRDELREIAVPWLDEANSSRSKISAPAELLDTNGQLQTIVEQFNEKYDSWSRSNGKAANFEFKYVQAPDGAFRKQLVAWDVVDMTTTPPEDVEAIGAEVQKVMEKLDGPIGV